MKGSNVSILSLKMLLSKRGSLNITYRFCMLIWASCHSRKRKIIMMEGFFFFFFTQRVQGYVIMVYVCPNMPRHSLSSVRLLWRGVAFVRAKEPTADGATGILWKRTADEWVCQNASPREKNFLVAKRQSDISCYSDIQTTVSWQQLTKLTEIQWHSRLSDWRVTLGWGSINKVNVVCVCMCKYDSEHS